MVGAAKTPLNAFSSVNEQLLRREVQTTQTHVETHLCDVVQKVVFTNNAPSIGLLSFFLYNSAILISEG